MQLQYRLGHHAKLLGRELELVGVAASQRRPGLGGGRDALAGLLQQGRIEAPELGCFVIDGPGLGQAIGRAHGGKHRGIAGSLGNRLGTKEKQVLHQPLGNAGLAARERAVLQENARGRAFAVDVGGAQAQRHSFEIGGADFPENTRLQRALGRGKAQADIAQGSGSVDIARLDDLQHQPVNSSLHRGVVSQRGRDIGQGQVDPAQFERPQIGRMHAVIAHEQQDIAVLGKQGHGRGILAFENAFEEFSQGKAGPLYLVGGVIAAKFGALHEFLGQRLHGAQDRGRHRHAHHLQGAHGLMQLLSCNAQLAGVEIGQIRAAREFRVAHKAAQRFGCTVE